MVVEISPATVAVERTISLCYPRTATRNCMAGPRNRRGIYHTCCPCCVKAPLPVVALRSTAPALTRASGVRNSRYRGQAALAAKNRKGVKYMKDLLNTEQQPFPGIGSFKDGGMRLFDAPALIKLFTPGLPEVQTRRKTPRWKRQQRRFLLRLPNSQLSDSSHTIRWGLQGSFGCEIHKGGWVAPSPCLTEFPSPRRRRKRRDIG